ncbi:MAG: transcriptional repressor [Coriobacteriales bacterium]|jgi:Fe2+ or Zn2+ uptake regulation protein|nr:transcriptional repressor [Coriobacteriales bacterium]
MRKRSTAQKNLIIQALQVLDHPTAAEVYESVRQLAPQISLGTVYRNLSQFSEDGTVLRISLRDEPDRFDPNTHAHHHAVCDECGRVIDTDNSLPAELIAQLDRTVEAATGLKVSRNVFFFHGVCGDCQTKNS